MHSTANKSSITLLNTNLNLQGIWLVKHAALLRSALLLSFSHVFAAGAHCLLLLSFLRADYFMRLFAVLCCAVLCSALFSAGQCCAVLCVVLCCCIVVVSCCLCTRRQFCARAGSRQPSTATALGGSTHTHTHTHPLHSALCTSHKSQSALEAAAAAGRGSGLEKCREKKNPAALLLALGKMKFKSLAKFLLLIKWKRAVESEGGGGGAGGLPRALIWLWWLLWSRRFSSHKFNQHQI